MQNALKVLKSSFRNLYNNLKRCLQKLLKLILFCYFNHPDTSTVGAAPSVINQIKTINCNFLKLNFCQHFFAFKIHSTHWKEIYMMHFCNLCINYFFHFAHVGVEIDATPAQARRFSFKNWAPRPATIILLELPMG